MTFVFAVGRSLATSAALALFAFTPAGSSPAAAQNTGDVDPAVVADMTSLFTGYCIDAFPDDARVDALAQKDSAVRLEPDQVRVYLDNDPGQGWFLHMQSGLYVVSIENPPHSTCAVRHISAIAFSAAPPQFMTVINDYAANRKATAFAIPFPPVKTKGGAEMSLYAYGLKSSDPNFGDSFGVMVEDFHSKVPDRLDIAHIPPEWGAGIAAGGVELRMFHQRVCYACALKP
jgi:hypothetical protein